MEFQNETLNPAIISYIAKKGLLRYEVVFFRFSTGTRDTRFKKKLSRMIEAEKAYTTLRPIDWLASFAICRDPIAKELPSAKKCDCPFVHHFRHRKFRELR